MPERPGPVLITGANSGIGLSTALRLASRGWDVWGTVRTAAKGDGLMAEAEKAGVAEHMHPFVLDVSDHDAIVAAWPDLPDFYAVVNNAGYSEMGAIEEVSAADAKAQLDVNLVTPAIVSSCALPGMRARGAGRIVMVSSMFGKAAVMPLNGWYHASKFGLEAMSDVLRMEVAGFGIKVAIVEPGFFAPASTASGRGSKSLLHMLIRQPKSAYERRRGFNGPDGARRRRRSWPRSRRHREPPPAAPVSRRVRRGRTQRRRAAAPA
jgi:NAD(P)-dependent dehydrogenase (short-subunit alcohol dehydrogenase family)